MASTRTKIARLAVGALTTSAHYRDSFRDSGNKVQNYKFLADEFYTLAVKLADLDDAFEAIEEAQDELEA